jgi:spectinomycin phosphotransferase
MRPEAAAPVLDDHYGLHDVDLTPVHGGADLGAVVWRAVDGQGRRFAVKCSGNRSPAGLLLPAALDAARPGSAPSPVPTRTGDLWVDIGGARLSVTAWVEGRSALDTPLGPAGWRSLGRLLAALHDLPAPEDGWLARDDFDPGRWARLFERVDAGIDAEHTDATARGAAELWRRERERLRAVHRRTLELARSLRGRGGLPRFAPCHADPHLGNLIVTGGGDVVLIDFDDAVLAPRERDLMFVLGGGVLADRPATAKQQRWFLEGYGPVEADPGLLAYYRGLRVLEDVSELAGVALDPGVADDDRRWALGHLRGVLSPTGLLAQV